jgi:tripartite-type tricarboxylate transporter receptor subunit TctC
MTIGRIAAAIIAACWVTAVAAAETPAEFYKGKTLTIIISTEPGGLYDVYGRLLARHMPKHIPGNPAAVVQNMPGAGGVKATNHIANLAPKDGTVIAGVHSGVPTIPLTSPDGVQFDPLKLGWIGSITKDPFVGYVWSSVPLNNLEEAKTKTVSMGAASFGTGGVDYLILANEFFGFKFKLVPGYKDSVEVKLAMERGEVQGTFANSYGDIRTTNMDWITEKKVRFIVQHGFEKHPDLPDVPLLMDQAKTEADRQALTFMLARQEHSKPYFAPPGTPPDRLDALRRAFDATMKDPDFLKEAAAARVAVEQPMTGEALAAIIAKEVATPTSAIERIQKTLAKYQSGK